MCISLHVYYTVTFNMPCLKNALSKHSISNMILHLTQANILLFVYLFPLYKIFYFTFSFFFGKGRVFKPYERYQSTIMFLDLSLSSSPLPIDINYSIIINFSCTVQELIFVFRDICIYMFPL